MVLGCSQRRKLQSAGPDSRGARLYLVAVAKEVSSGAGLCSAMKTVVDTGLLGLTFHRPHYAWQFQITQAVVLCNGQLGLHVSLGLPPTVAGASCNCDHSAVATWSAGVVQL